MREDQRRPEQTWVEMNLPYRRPPAPVGWVIVCFVAVGLSILLVLIPATRWFALALATTACLIGYVLSSLYRRTYHLMFCVFVAMAVLFVGMMEQMESNYRAKQDVVLPAGVQEVQEK